MNSTSYTCTLSLQVLQIMAFDKTICMYMYFQCVDLYMTKESAVISFKHLIGPALCNTHLVGRERRQCLITKGTHDK